MIIAPSSDSIYHMSTALHRGGKRKKEKKEKKKKKLRGGGGGGAERGEETYFTASNLSVRFPDNSFIDFNKYPKANQATMHRTVVTRLVQTHT